MRLWTGVCETLMQDVVVPGAHQNARSYVREYPFDSLCKNLAWWAVTRRTSNNHKTVKIGGWVACPGQCSSYTMSVKLIYVKVHHIV